jgi:hypothetical protein
MYLFVTAKAEQALEQYHIIAPQWPGELFQTATMMHKSHLGVRNPLMIYCQR